MRIHTAPLKAMLESTAQALDSAGAFPALPESLGGASLTDLLARGDLKFTVDPKFPQAIGITNVLNMVLILGNSAWAIISPARKSSVTSSKSEVSICELTAHESSILRSFLRAIGIHATYARMRLR
jgi:hypothetical protein